MYEIFYSQGYGFGDKFEQGISKTDGTRNLPEDNFNDPGEDLEKRCVGGFGWENFRERTGMLPLCGVRWMKKCNFVD